jgi:hypothetical protein
MSAEGSFELPFFVLFAVEKINSKQLKSMPRCSLKAAQNWNLIDNLSYTYQGN